MKRPDYIKDADGQSKHADGRTDHATLLRIANAVRLGDHAAAAALTASQVNRMADLIVVRGGEDRVKVILQGPAYVATRYSIARGDTTPAREAEDRARRDMIAADRNASRPGRHTDARRAGGTALEQEELARASMQRDQANAWRKGRKI